MAVYDDGIIACVGWDEDVLKLKKPGTTVLDLQGRYITPVSILATTPLAYPNFKSSPSQCCTLQGGGMSLVEQMYLPHALYVREVAQK